MWTSASTPRAPSSQPSGSAQTILLIGSDHRATAAKHDARSDTMMLVRLSPRAKAVTVLSVPRDLKVTIPGKGTAKLNAAYAYGGAPLTVKTLHQVLGIGIDHVIDVDFAGFRALVNRLGCVYTDVDRHYFNRNVGTAATNYASIDIQAGYQRLCGRDALDYVRYRHGDNDLVRAARQHDFLRQARTQLDVKDLLGDRHELLRALGEHTSTDIRGSKQVAALVKLAIDAAGKPVQEVPFPATLGPSYVYATPAAIRTTVRRFLHPATALRSRRRRRARKATRATGLVPAAAPRTLRARFAVLYPTRRVAGAVYDSARAYALPGPPCLPPLRACGRRRVLRRPGHRLDQPPILAAPDARRTLGRRTFELTTTAAASGASRSRRPKAPGGSRTRSRCR